MTLSDSRISFRSSLQLVLAALVVAGLSPSSAGAQVLESFVLTAGGNATCSTFGAPAVVYARFGAHGVFEPAPSFAACNVPANMRFTSAPGGSLSDNSALQTSWSLGTFDGNTEVQARHGKLRAAARSVYTGSTSSRTVSGAEGFATCLDSLTITSPSVAAGMPGSVRIRVAVAGTLSTTTGTADVELNYRLGNAIVYTMFRGQTYNPAAVPFLVAGTGSPLTGFTLGPGTASGSDVVETFLTPFLFGSPMDFDLRLLAYTVPSLTGTTVSDFRARIVEIQVFSGAQPVSDFQIRSASGTRYGKSGGRSVVVPVPLRMPPLTLSIPFVLTVED